jgi:hypothetical protein
MLAARRLTEPCTRTTAMNRERQRAGGEKLRDENREQAEQHGERDHYDGCLYARHCPRLTPRFLRLAGINIEDGCYRIGEITPANPAMLKIG